MKKSNSIYVTLSGKDGAALLRIIDTWAIKKKWSRAQVARELMTAGVAAFTRTENETKTA